jgi:hypothetical protein
MPATAFCGWDGACCSASCVRVKLLPFGIGTCVAQQTNASSLVTADQIPTAHTPPGGYGAVMPPPVLAGCSEPLEAGAPDLRGNWSVVSFTGHGAEVGGVQRIEQCGNRVVITAQGVVHDMRADGSVARGVHDVTHFGYQTPVIVAARFTDGALVLQPVGLPLKITRRLKGDQLVFDYIGFVAVCNKTGAASN